MNYLFKTMIPVMFAFATLVANGDGMDLETAVLSLGLEQTSSSDVSRSYSTAVGEAEFFLNSRKLLLNGTLVWLNEGIFSDENGWKIKAEDFYNTLVPVITPGKIRRAPFGAGIVVLDPGHGGSDSGAASGEDLEKDLVMDIASRAASNLCECSFNVRLTRDKDVVVTLADRVSLARKFAADFLISIHLNVSANTDAHGLETYVMPGIGFASTAGNTLHPDRYHGNMYDAYNILAGYHIHKAVLETTNCADRGIKRARFAVLREAPCPAILIECGFMSNTQEMNLLSSSAYREKIAEGITLGVMNYFKFAGITSVSR